LCFTALPIECSNPGAPIPESCSSLGLELQQLGAVDRAGGDHDLAPRRHLLQRAVALAAVITI
jgi:hypothetical protein